MKFYCYGAAGLPVVMLIHGGGNSKWMFERAARLMKDKYRIIVPELDGHGEEHAIMYMSTREEAEKIIRYIDENLDGRLFCIAGASLGSQIAMEILGTRPRIAERAFLESGICRPKKAWARLMSRRMIDAMEKMYRWKWLVRLQCKYSGWPLEIADKITEDVKAVSADSNYNLYRTYFSYELPGGLHQTSAKVLVICGSKESRVMKAEIRYAASQIPESKTDVFEGHGHCGCSLGDPRAYADKLQDFMES